MGQIKENKLAHNAYIYALKVSTDSSCNSDIHHDKDCNRYITAYENVYYALCEIESMKKLAIEAYDKVISFNT